MLKLNSLFSDFYFNGVFNCKKLLLSAKWEKLLMERVFEFDWGKDWVGKEKKRSLCWLKWIVL